MLSPDTCVVWVVFADVVRTMSVTQFLAVGHITRFGEWEGGKGVN